MERACSNALALAEHIQKTYPEIKVNYPGLPDSHWHEIAEKQFPGYYGAILTLRTGSRESAFRLINALKLPLKVSNIGDTKTLVIHPESTISVHSTEEEKKALEKSYIRIGNNIYDAELAQGRIHFAGVRPDEIEKPVI